MFHCLFNCKSIYFCDKIFCMENENDGIKTKTSEENNAEVICEPKDSTIEQPAIVEKSNIEAEPASFERQKKPAKVIEIVTSSSIFKYFLGAMIIFAVCFVSCLYVFQIVLTPIGVEGYSMQPTINASATGTNGDSHTDTVYFFSSSIYAYKDIVIIKEGKTTSNEKLIKRIIATPGQTITFIKTYQTMQNTQVCIYFDIYIDGVLLEEDYILEQEQYVIKYNSTYSFYNRFVRELSTTGQYTIDLEDNQYFVMGDNRNNSTDSRFFGPIEKSDILGKVVLQVKYGRTLFNAIWIAIFGAKIY